MKSKGNKLDIAKLETTPVDLSKLSNLVKNDVVKKTEYDELVKKVNTIQTTGTSDLVKKTDYNTKVNDIKKKTTDHNHCNKDITTQEFNKVTAEHFAAILAPAKLGTNADIADFIKKDRF